MIKLSRLPEWIAERIDPEPYSNCWLWAGSCSSRGYPKFGRDQISVHRAMYEMYIDGIDEGFDVHHKCRTPCCVNPSHLEVLSRADHRQLHTAEQTHCRNGHEFTGENTYYWCGHRLCKKCRVVNTMAWEKRQGVSSYDPVYQKAYREAHREKASAYNKAWRARKKLDEWAVELA